VSWDGDLYGWDEAMLYTRDLVVVVTRKRPPRWFDILVEGMVLRGVTWSRVVDGRYEGGRVEVATRMDFFEVRF